MIASKIITTVGTLAVIAFANPVPSTSVEAEPILSKRAEGVHLVNCVTYSAVIVRLGTFIVLRSPYPVADIVLVLPK